MSFPTSIYSLQMLAIPTLTDPGNPLFRQSAYDWISVRYLFRKISLSPSLTRTMLDDAHKIKLELPSKLQAFSFTFETKRPGPMTVEITLRWPTKRPRLLQVPEHVDLSATEPKTPDRLQVMRWQEAQKYKKSAAGTMARIDAEETFDSSDTEKETLAEFTRWYKAKGAHEVMGIQSRGTDSGLSRGLHQ
ncbi:hypothetical protein DFJ58DRAFT_845103 [Suillus subalutaceus]|uniref:uncharacterized protein n=1 Tax=Suillus subalutaceus TaxID=48586 RepID=UPI001B87BF91|nr:uncharacterized protein DFJ58DRAFT_845103 [Suillus subalutaceus]KAG1841112.1 hypothetical protein DFJ58DRAFT_845103 [Suillus subalutaceus]